MFITIIIYRLYAYVYVAHVDDRWRDNEGHKYILLLSN